MKVQDYHYPNNSVRVHYGDSVTIDLHDLQIDSTNNVKYLAVREPSRNDNLILINDYSKQEIIEVTSDLIKNNLEENHMYEYYIVYVDKYSNESATKGPFEFKVLGGVHNLPPIIQHHNSTSEGDHL